MERSRDRFLKGLNCSESQFLFYFIPHDFLTSRIKPSAGGRTLSVGRAGWAEPRSAIAASLRWPPGSPAPAGAQCVLAPSPDPQPPDHNARTRTHSHNFLEVVQGCLLCTKCQEYIYIYIWVCVCVYIYIFFFKFRRSGDHASASGKVKVTPTSESLDPTFGHV